MAQSIPVLPPKSKTEDLQHKTTKPKTTKPKSKTVKSNPTEAKRQIETDNVKPKPSEIKSQIETETVKPKPSVLKFTNENDFLLEMIFVEGGTFTMGDLIGDGSANEKPTHQIILSDFYIGRYEVTVKQYNAYLNETDRRLVTGKKNEHPMSVDYDMALGFCNWLGAKYGGDWSLPTEAQWEYAARGGKKSRNYIYSGSNDLWEVGWFVKNSSDKAQLVGQKKANELGLFDMSGNMKEWCKDWYDQNYYSISPSDNPLGPQKGERRVARGGTYFNGEFMARVSCRDRADPAPRQLWPPGFRVVYSK